MPRKPKKPKLPQYVVIKAGEWYVRRTFPSTEISSNGRYKRIEITHRCIPRTEERARQLAKQIETKARTAPDDHADSKTVGTYITHYLSIKKGSVAQRTHQDYENLFNRHIQGTFLAETLLPNVTTKLLQSFVTLLVNTGRSPEMIHKVFVLIKMTFRQAVLWDDLSKNPVLGVILPAVKKKEAVAMTKAEAQRFIKVLQSKPENLLFELNLETGLRPQEIVALTWNDIDFTRRRVRVDKAIADGLRGGGFEVKSPKTQASYRTVGFSAYMKERLVQHREQQQDFLKLLREQIAAPHVKGMSQARKKSQKKNTRERLRNFLEFNLVFPASNGVPIKKNNLNRRQFKSLLAEAGLEVSKFSLKTLRHTHASIMAEQVSPKRLQKQLGHENISTTLGFYVHVDEDNEAEFTDKFTKTMY